MKNPVSAFLDDLSQPQRQTSFLDRVIESLPYPFYVINPNSYVVEIANSAARSLGRPAAQTCHMLTHGRKMPCQDADHPCPVAEVRRTRRTVRMMHVHTDSLGHERYVEVHGYPLLDDDGNVSRVIEYELDVTEQVRAERDLRESERRHRQLLDTLQEGIWAVDATDRTAFVNPRMAEMLGYEVDEMLGTSLFDHMDAEGAAICRQNLERRRQGIQEQHDFEFLCKDGSRIYASLSTSPILDEDGSYAGSIAGIKDISEQREAQEALMRSETLLRETQKIARVGGWELDLTTSDLVWTEEVYHIHEVPLSFVPTLESALSFYHPEDRPILESAIQRAIDVGEPWDLELRLVTAKGSYLWVRAMGRATRDEDRVVKLSGTFQDITERKHGERALEEAMRAAEEARYAESQRRRVAEGLAEVLEDLNSDRPQAQVLKRIATEAQHLLNSRAVVISAPGARTGVGISHEASMDADFCSSSEALQTVMETGESLIVSRCEQSAARLSDECCGWPCRTLLVVPVVIKGRSVGGLLLYFDRAESLAPEQLGLAQVFANQVALALENARLRAQAEEAAAAAARSRLARDLHDSVTQTLFSASIIAETLPRLSHRNPNLVERGLAELHSLTRGALAEMRTLLVELRPAALLEGRLDELLQQLATAVTNRAKVDVVLDIEPVGSLPPEVQIAVYRVAQEALNNVVKHAGAHEAMLTLRVTPPPEPTPHGDTLTALALEIRDDGRGFDPQEQLPDRLGLSIMRERAASIGARLDIDGKPGVGTTVTLVWSACGQAGAG